MAIVVSNVILTQWQKDLSYYLDKADDRKIFWIYGVEGNEGKTFFRKYILSLYGNRRVLSINMQSGRKGMFRFLSKQPLVCKDIFLFDISRTLKRFNFVYDVIESIKDGRMSDLARTITFKTPNVVMVFANKPPKVEALSLDRWKIFQIKNNELLSSLIEEEKY